MCMEFPCRAIWRLYLTAVASHSRFTQLHYTGVSKTPDSFWNLKTHMPATRHFCIDCHHVQCCLEFSVDGALVSASPNCGSGIVYRNRVGYNYRAWFLTAVSKT